ncbi:THO complex subunit 5 homolog isoform X2 [Sitophilus oryzae]|uniref:THO complex subunit 5 homolog isoform X2 n=1 Tax=Sitophilus oryzae TaxID=7048 RepID=A0A6J2XMU5_SITOR|nr:THO complex subunit 5 homolog isoform X2 [Sitophilus oryzae]
MVKENSNAVKKKRKANTTEADAETDIYKKACDFEENESQNRNSSEDAELFFQICQEIHDFLDQVRELKQSSGDTSQKLSCLTDIVVKICVIKKLNRLDKLAHVLGREALNTEKQKCDSIKLTYQNLVYELHHLVTETNKCLSFKSEDEDIELVSFEDFMKNAPEAVSKKFIDFDPNDSEQDHALRLARLEWELTQRKNLAEECKALEEKKKKVVEEITERKERLNDLLPLLTTVIKATKPLQEHLGMSSELTRKEHKLAPLLSDPLYVLYANIVAYKSVFETNINVSILGDKDDATQFNEAQEVSHSNNLNEEDSEPESDLPEVEEVVEVKKRRHRKSVQQVDPVEEKKKKLLEVHPLTVQLSLSITDGPSLVIIFSYYTKLKTITVKSQVDMPSNFTYTAREILSGHNILSELLDNDTGMESPNPSTAYQLKKLGLGSFQTLVPDIGYAYGWAQSICGIDFLTPKRYCDKLSQQSVETILKITKKRLNTRTHLAKQMQQLEKNILSEIPEELQIPTTAISSLNKWSSTTYQDFCLAEYTQHLLDENLVSQSDLFYSAKISRDEATLNLYIVIRNTYPIPAPIVALCLDYKGKYTSTNCDEIRDLERTINIDWNYGIRSSSWLLSAQITHLCSYLDVYLETLDSNVFQPNAKFIRSVSGRNKKRPFKFRKIGTGLFTQY